MSGWYAAVTCARTVGKYLRQFLAYAMPDADPVLGMVNGRTVHENAPAWM
jgi:hypothetical protein